MEMIFIQALVSLSITTAITQALTLTNPLPQLVIPRCGYLRYKIPENTFHDPIQGNTRSLELSLKTAAGESLPQADDFIAFSPVNQTLTAVLTDEKFKDAKLPKRFSYRLVAKTRRGTAAFAILQLTLEEAWRNTTISFLVNFVWAAKHRPPLPIILSVFSDKLSKYLNSDASLLRFTHVWTPAGAYSIGVTNCTLPSGTCKATENVKSQLLNVATLKPAFLPEIYLSYAQVKLAASCVPPQGPRVLKAYPVITLTPCTPIEVRIPPDIFYDEVDGYNLQLSVHAIDGKRPTAQDIWIDIDTGTKTLYGVVTDKVITEQPPYGYNITIRAYDTHFLWAETFMIVKIEKKPIQRYYQFILRLTLLGNSIFEPHLDQDYLVGAINRYFKANFTNIMSYHVTGGKHVTLRSSICTLPLKCDNMTFDKTLSQMVSMGSPLPAFKRIFSLWYQLVSVSPYVDPVCQRVINPPVPSINPWIVPATNCGGFRIKIPADIFTDVEEGNVRSLKVDLYTNDGFAPPKTSWVHINSTSQVLYGLPSKEDITNYNSLSYNKQHYNLVATDRTGANGSLSLRFVFPPQRPSTYVYQLVYITTQFQSDFQEKETFSNKLQSYLHSTGHSSFSLQKYVVSSATYRRIYFANCSVRFNPCDIQLVNGINSRLFSSMTPTAAFKNAMKPEFSVMLASVTNTSNCGPGANAAPRILHPMVTWRISVCGIQKQSVPIHTFHDREDGYTRKLTLTVTDNANRSLGLNSFVQFDSSMQVMTSAASVLIAETQSAPTFLLTAMDKGGLSISLPFQTSINGPLQILKNCRIQTKFGIGHSLIGKSNVYLAERIMADMTAYFGFGSSNKIGVVSIVRESSSRISFSWSYCSASYSHYTHSSVTTNKTVNMVDYQGFADILRKVFVPGTFHVHSGFKSCFRDLTVLSVVKIFSRQCSTFPPVIGLNATEVTLNVSNCGYTKVPVTKDWFYDLEDGDAHNLKLKLTDSNMKQITKVDNWVNFDESTKTIVIALTDREQNLGIKTSKLYLTATDSNGLSARLPLVINIIANIMPHPRFQITFEFLNNHTVSYLNDLVYLSDRIANVYALLSGRDVMIKSLHEGNGYVDSTTLTWSLCHQSVCSSNVLKRAREHLGFEAHFNSLKEQFLSQFILQRASISHTCGGPTSSPSTSMTSINFNITMCGVAVFTLPPSLFYDVTDGATKNMEIHLLDNNNNHVSASSWIQLNTATLQLYAVPSLEAKLFQAANTFRLQATNSRNQSAKVVLNATVSEQPYTSSCSVTIVVERKFGTERTVDLKVLHKLLRAISDYYLDQEIKMKVLKFSKLSKFTYSLTYNNCSLTFPTKEESHKGYDESSRLHIFWPIMRRIITRGGLIQTAFSSFMQRLFKIVSVRARDTCIEAPPFRSGDKTERTTYAYTCREYRDPLPRDMFNDVIDGTNLKYSITYPSGQLVSPSDWIAFDEKRMEVYGMVTEDVKKRAPLGDRGYHYLIVATDSSGRSANNSYYIPITSPLPLLQTKFSLAFKTSFIESTPTATVLVNISRSIAKYLDGSTLADDILIHSYTPGRSLVFGHCKEKCTATYYQAVASKLQLTVSKPKPAPGLITALKGSVAPQKIFIDGSACLPKSNATIIVTMTCNITYPSVCGFIDYHINNKTFTDNFGRTTNDFILSMNIRGKALTESKSVFSFNSASQLFYGPIIASRVQKTLIYDLIGKHPVSGSIGTTSLILNLRDVDAFKKASKSLCIVTVQITASYNPAFTAGYIVRKFTEKTAAYLGISYQEMQIISYSWRKTYPIQMSVSFANCKWYQWLGATNSFSYTSMYVSSRKSIMQKCFVNYEQTTAYNQLFWNALSPDFRLVSVSANKWCNIEPNKPPTVNITTIIITVTPCTQFVRLIPTECFFDEDGSTRDLLLQMHQHDGSQLTAASWMKFNQVTQTAYGTAPKYAQSSQSADHRFQLKATDKYGLSATSTVVVKFSGTAPTNEPPKIVMNNFRITLPDCGIYRAKLPAGFAVDKEDGDMKNLRVELRTMTGTKLSRDSWVQFDEKTYEIYTLASKLSSGSTGMRWSYKVYIYDSCGGETTGTIQLITKAPQITYYQHVFTFTSLIAKATYLDIQIKFLQLISSYFGATSSNYKVISFVKQTGLENYTFKFSNCSTTRYLCSKANSYLITQQNVFIASKTGTNSFASFIKSFFRMTSYSSETHYEVDKPPSNTSSTLTDIEVTSCGGYTRDISQGIFTERETQSALRYSMEMTSGRSVTKGYPAQLISNQLHVIPFGASKILSVRIIATDHCNQTAYQDIEIRINIPSKPRGYEITCSANVNTQNSAVYYLMQFKAMLKAYLKNPLHSIRVLSYSRVHNSVNFTWTSCHSVEEKCNKTDIKYLKTTLFISNNVTNPSFIESAKSVFDNVKLLEYDKDCNFTSPEPPVNNGSLSVSVDLCRKIDFRIPITAFSDMEDGDTRSLHLSLLTENRQLISFTSWLQFNRVTQTIYGYPRFPTATATFQRNYRYSLVASDIQGNTALMPVSVSIKGSLTILYTLTLHGTIALAHFGPNVDLEIILIRKIGSFFKDYAINDISFGRNGKSFSFSWSFCGMRTDKCDCFFIKKVETTLRNMTSFRHQMLPEFAARTVFTTVHGVCKYSGAPQLMIDKRAVYINAGQSFSYYIEDGHFYDQEDGYTKNLTLLIANNENKIVTSTHWLQIQKQYICGLVLLSELRKSEWRSSSSEYKLVARDACGKEAMDKFTVNMNAYRSMLYYKIRVYVTNSYTNVRGNCSKMETFAYYISRYLKTNLTSIYIENIYVNNSFSNQTQTKNNYTVIVWGVRNFTLKNCKNETVRSFREKFVYGNGSVNQGFYQFMKHDFNVVKVDDDNSTCVNATFIPLVFIKVGLDFPFWILILLLILAILLLLCWCCWVFIPRCCPGCCAGCLESCCGCCGSLCGKCCMPGGKYASLDEVPLAPEVESGVLSNARTAPEESATKLGKEAEPDEPEAGMLANPLPDSSGYDSSSKVDEEEMKIEQNAAPTDYYATPEYLQKADNLGLVTDVESSRGTDEAFSDSSFVPSLHSATAPLPKNIESGVAPLPRDHLELPDAGNSLSEDYDSSMTSYGEDIEEGILAQPLPDNFNSIPYPGHRSVVQQQSMEHEVISQAQAPVPAGVLSLPEMPNVYSDSAGGSRVVTESRNAVETESRNVVRTEARNAPNQDRRVSVSSTVINEGRRVSLGGPMRLLVPRDASIDMDKQEFKNNDSSSGRISTVRRKSKSYFFDDMSLGGGSSQERRMSQIFLQDGGDYGQSRRRVSVVRLNGSSDALTDNEPIQLKVVDDSGISYASPWEDNHQESRSTMRRVSLVSNGRLTGSRSDDMLDSVTRERRSSWGKHGGLKVMNDKYEYNPRRRMSTALRRISIGANSLGAVSDPGYPSRRRMSNAQRVSVSTHKASSASGSKTMFQDTDDELYDYSDGPLVRGRTHRRTSTAELLGFESDSTDSGYAITRRSRRYRRKEDLTSRQRNEYKPIRGHFNRNNGYDVGSDVGKKRSGHSEDRQNSGYKRNGGYNSQNDAYDIDDGYGKKRVRMRRKSISRIANGESAGTRRSSGRNLSPEYEMWSRDHQVYRNNGYESDSYV